MPMVLDLYYAELGASQAKPKKCFDLKMESSSGLYPTMLCCFCVED